MLLAGSSEVAVRFPTVFAGILLVPLVYALGRLIFPRRPEVALIGAMLAAVNPSLIWDAQDAHLYAFLTLTALGSFIAFLYAMRARAPRVVWATFVMSSALGLYLHYFAGFTVIAEGVIALYWIAARRLDRRTIILWILAQAAVAALFLPWLVLALPLLINFRTEFLPPANLLEILSRTLTGYTVGRVDARVMPPMVEPPTGNLLALGFLAIFLVGLVYRLRDESIEEKLGRGVLMIYLFAPLVLIALLSVWRFPMFDERYVLFLISAFLLILARGFVGLRELTRQRWASAGALLFVLLASGNSLYNYFYLPTFAKSPDWQGLVRHLAVEARPGDVLVQNYPDPALPYYLQERVPRVLLPRSSSATSAEVSADLKRLTAKYARVWLQPVPYATWDTAGLVETWLSRHARPLRAYEFRGLRLALYLPASVALRQAKPIDATFVERIRLIAFELDASTLRPGATVHLVLYWKALDRLERDATVFVHLYGADGKLWAQQDNPPVHGTFPTSQWEANEIIVDSYDVWIPPDAPAGDYTLMVGMYDAQTSQRWNVVDDSRKPFSENRVLLTHFNLISSSGVR
jgi:4-amino-4-deoxy-L-arabinose transferase-like glycosyltransferase